MNLTETRVYGFLLLPFMITILPLLLFYEAIFCSSPDLLDEPHSLKPQIRTFLHNGTIYIGLFGVVVCLIPFMPLLWCMNLLFEIIFPLFMVITPIQRKQARMFIFVVVCWPYALAIMFNLIGFLTCAFWAVICVVFCWDPILYYWFPRWLEKWNYRKYRPLNSSNNSIRLIKILPGPPNTPICCQLIYCNWDVEYGALSYTWGGHLVFRRKLILDGRSFFVTDNLWRALAELRDETSARNIWIDALCINQTDLLERANQVAKMRQIYLNARMVTVWLGAAPRNVEGVFDLCRKFTDRMSQEQIRDIAPALENCQSAIMNLTRRRWWKRVWVIQEVVAAEQAQVMAGKFKLDWSSLSTSILAIEKYPELNLDVAQDVYRFVRAVARLKSTATDPRTGLLNLAYTFQDMKARDGRDKLFGLMGLLHDADNALPLADYTTEKDVVFKRFTMSCIRKYGTLSVLALAEQGCVRETSWAVDWEKSRDSKCRFPLWNDGLYEMTDLDSGYCADGGHSLSIGNSTNEAILPLRGFEIEEVALVGSRMRDVGELFGTDELNLQAIAMESWETLAGGPWDESSHEKKMAFNRTILADPTADSLINWRKFIPEVKNRFQREYRTTQEQSSEFWPITNSSRPNEAYHMHPPDNTEGSGNAEEWLVDRMRKCCRRRRFFITRTGRFCLGPVDIGKGDKLVVLLGSPVPVVLRRSRTSWTALESISLSTDKWAGSEQLFKFIGQAYVDSAMVYSGDIEEDIRVGNLQIRDFCIV